MAIPTIAIVSRKGGVGKTQSAMNLATVLDSQGHRVLIIDMDPQGTATLFGLGGQPARDQGRGLLDALTGSGCIARAARRVRYLQRAEIVPSGPALHGAPMALQATVAGGQLALRAALDRAIEGGAQWSHVIVDCPPGIDLLIRAALGAATSVLVPTTPQESSVAGVAELSATVADMARINPGMTVVGLLLTQVDPRSTRDAAGVMERLNKQIGEGAVLDSYVRRDRAVERAERYWRPVVRRHASANASEDYRDVTRELLTRIQPAAVAVGA
jgi:chromosome partitioning protein